MIFKLITTKGNDSSWGFNCHNAVKSVYNHLICFQISSDIMAFGIQFSVTARYSEGSVNPKVR